MMMAANSEKRTADVVIVGGGASGLAAAVSIGMESDLRVTVIEKMDEPGRKIRASGSGRCNITNTAADGYIEIMKFFTRIGLVTRTYGNGLVYPHSESASDAADLLVSRAKELGVSFACGEEVISVAAHDDTEEGRRFLVTSRRRDKDGERSVLTEASYVILASGGKAGPMFGTTGDGYRIARELGHSIVTPVPALTGIECSEWAQESVPRAISLAGNRTRGRVTLFKNGTEEIFEEDGEIQFTAFGLSGICVFNMTRHMRYDRTKGESLSDHLVTADLWPDGNAAEFLKSRRAGAFPGERAADVLRTVLREDIAKYVIDLAAAAGTDSADKEVRDLTDQDIDRIAGAVHSMTFHPVKLRGWKDAQVTMGGVSLDEIDGSTSESKLLSGLYITGELADRDFQCGGFNLSNAWITGLSAAGSIISEEKK